MPTFAVSTVGNTRRKGGIRCAIEVKARCRRPLSWSRGRWLGRIGWGLPWDSLMARARYARRTELLVLPVLSTLTNSEGRQAETFTSSSSGTLIFV